MRDASRSRIARLFARLATKQIAPPSTAPKGLHEKCPAAALHSSSHRTSLRPCSGSLQRGIVGTKAVPSGCCIGLLIRQRNLAAQIFGGASCDTDGFTMNFADKVTAAD